MKQVKAQKVGYSLTVAAAAAATMSLSVQAVQANYYEHVYPEPNGYALSNATQQLNTLGSFWGSSLTDKDPDNAPDGVHSVEVQQAFRWIPDDGNLAANPAPPKLAYHDYYYIGGPVKAVRDAGWVQGKAEANFSVFFSYGADGTAYVPQVSATLGNGAATVESSVPAITQPNIAIAPS